MASRDQLIDAIARTNHGVFTRADALRVGFTWRMIAQRVASGRWLQLDQDVFAVASAPATWQRACAAAIARHPAAALSHTTAATALGLDGYRPGSIHVTVPPTANHVTRLATVHRSRHTQFTVVDGLRTTTFAQVVVQLAGMVSSRSLLAAIHSGIHQQPSRLDELWQRVGELRDRRMPGMTRIVDALEELDGQPPTASELERLLFTVLADVRGLPPVLRQVPFEWSEGARMVTDAYIPTWQLILEADGRSWHTRVADFDRDRWRDAEAATRGIHVMRFGWHRLRHDAEGVVDQLERFGSHRERHVA